MRKWVERQNAERDFIFILRYLHSQFQLHFFLAHRLAGRQRARQIGEIHWVIYAAIEETFVVALASPSCVYIAICTNRTIKFLSSQFFLCVHLRKFCTQILKQSVFLLNCRFGGPKVLTELILFSSFRMNKFLSCAKRIFTVLENLFIFALFSFVALVWRAKDIEWASKTLFMKFSASIIVCFWIRFWEIYFYFSRSWFGNSLVEALKWT